MSDKPNILLLMADQLRADHLGWSRQSRMETPNFDRLAEGTVFERLLTANPICTPARCALLTGRYTHQIGMLAMSGDLSREIPTYPQALQRAGYSTAGIGKFHWLQTWPWGTQRGKGLDLAGMEDAFRDYGFDHVWEASGKQLSVQNYCHYCRHLEKNGRLEKFRDHVLSSGQNHNEANNVEFTGDPWPLPEEDYPDIVITDQILDWLEKQNGKTPFFLFGSWLSPHQPLDPPKSYLDQIPYEEIDDFVQGDGEEAMAEGTRKRMWKLRRSYKAMVRLLDDQMGRILSKLEEKGILDNTVILFVADHGEMLGDHGRFQKSIHWHQSAVVPSAIRHPGFLRSHRVATPVELTDLTATVLDLAGLNPRESLSRDWPRMNDIIPGKSLLSCVRGETDRLRDYAFSECQGQWSMIHSDRFSYVRFHGGEPDAKQELLFDLQADPNEQHDLAADPAFAEELAWHRTRLFHVLETTPPCQTSWAKYAGP